MEDEFNIRILIVHGWMQSAKRYMPLKKVLKLKFKSTIDIYKFPGFGDSKPLYKENILDSYIKDFKEFLQKHEYDYIIACSMGANVVIKSLDIIPITTNVILLSPIYYGISKLKNKVISNNLLLKGLSLFTNIPLFMQNIIIKGFSLYSINNWQNVDTRVIRDVLRADKLTATVTLHELVYDKWKLSEKDQHNVTIIIGEDDKVFSRSRLSLLMHSLGKHTLHIIPNTGHMVIIEAFSSVCKIIITTIKQGTENKQYCHTETEVKKVELQGSSKERLEELQEPDVERLEKSQELSEELEEISGDELEGISDEDLEEISDEELREIEEGIYK